MSSKILIKLPILCVLMLTSLLYSVERITTDKKIESQRDYNLHYYENDTAISHWYGSDSWAVKFVASDFDYANSMTITGVNIYFPTIPQNPVSIRGFTYSEDSQFNPMLGQSLEQLEILSQTILTSGWNYFPLSEAYTGTGLWIIIDNQTNFNNNYMATAEGSGENSYYKGTINNQPYFYSLANLNVEQELLYSVEGYLSFENEDSLIRIEDVSLEKGEEDLWGYNFRIRNYSNQAYSQAELEIKVEHPIPDIFPPQSTFISIDLPPMIDITSNFDEEINIALPIENSQFKITSNLRLVPEDDIISSKIIRVLNFQEDSDVALIMNFFSGNTQITQGILDHQQEFIQDNWYVLNYGVDSSDLAIYSDYAYDYYQYLGINLIPMTAINGSSFFNSYNLQATEDNINNNISYLPKIFNTLEEVMVEEEPGSITFYTSFNYGDSFVFDDFTNDLQINVFISQKTKHFTQVGDEFILNEITDVNYDFERLNNGGNGFYEFRYQTDSVDSLLTSANGEKYANVIIYRNNTKEIISYTRYNLEDNILVSNTDYEDHPHLEQVKLLVYPNPVQAGKELNVQSVQDRTSDTKIDRYNLYNIKGQRVTNFVTDKQRIKLPKHIASGIYFLQPIGKEIYPLSKLVIIKE